MQRQRQHSSTTDEPHQCCGACPSRGSPLLIFFFLVTMVIVMSAAITPITPSNIAAAHERSGCDGSTIVRHLAFVDEGRIDPVTIEIARAEVESIWATAGVRLLWVSGAPGGTPRPDAYVVLRAGRANATRQAAMMKSELSSQLGWVRFNRQGGHSHLVEVSLANVRLSLTYAWHDNTRLLFQPDSVQIVVMGRALGRVAAHEFGHWLLGRGHEAEGLMKAELRPHELMAPEPPRLPRAWTDPGDPSDPRITRLRALCG
jgi:hypothetical protein